jgi:polysaccharide export outer membrane protein
MRQVAALVVAASIGAWGCAAGRGATPVERAPAAATAARPAPAPRPPAAPVSPAAGSVAARAPASPGAAASAPRAALGGGPISAAAPAADYRVASRDQLSVQVYGQDDLTRTVRVSENGTITLPLIGEIPVAGLSPREIETTLEKALSPAYLRNPRVTVAVSEYQGHQISVIGAVNQPGAFPFRSNQVSLLQALSEAHGVRENADRVAYVVRAVPRPDEAQPLEVDLDALMRRGQGTGVMLESGDSVYVPEANTFYVTGEVEKRGAYTLRRDTTISKAIVEAGGVTNRAATGKIAIVRSTGSGERKEITDLDLSAILKGDPQHDLPLQAQDVVVVPSSSAKNIGYGVLEFLRGIFSIGIPIL